MAGEVYKKWFGTRSSAPLLKVPKASNYVVVTSKGRNPPYFSLIGTGCSVLNIILQAEIRNKASKIAVIGRDQMKKIQGIRGLMDTPFTLVRLDFL